MSLVSFDVLIHFLSLFDLVGEVFFLFIIIIVIIINEKKGTESTSTTVSTNISWPPLIDTMLLVNQYIPSLFPSSAIDYNFNTISIEFNEKFEEKKRRNRDYWIRLHENDRRNRLAEEGDESKNDQAIQTRKKL